MSLFLYNTLSREKEEFKPIEPGKVKLYACGPTVYWYPHIGNMKAYIHWDILKKTLDFLGFDVKYVMNVTDVGHLTSDADTGEDKMEKAAKKEGKNAQEIADFYFQAFRDNLKKLNISEPDIWCKATEHIKQQIELIKKLEEKGFTYKTSDGIYFDTSKDEKYGELARLNKEGLEAGKRIDLGEKKNNTDFALWKFSSSEEKRQQEWDSPWGIGFPGWHIECSAMSMNYLGNHFDIHTGGQDHIQVHHTNEIAQAENATGEKFVNYWLHNAWLLFEGEKVSKSKGGLYTLPDLEQQGFDGDSFRYLILQAHYRKPLNFSLDGLKVSQQTLQRLKNLLLEIEDDGKTNEDYLNSFKESLEDDLNTPKALQELWKLVRDEKAEGKIKTVKKMDEVLSLNLFSEKEIEVPEEIKKLIEEREKARESKDWKLSDELRDKIKENGFIVEDKDKGPVLKRI